MTPASRICDDHFQAWLSQVNEACGQFNGRKLDPGFVGQLEKCQAGQISMSIVDMTQVNLFRGPREIRASGADNYYAVLQLAGTSRIEHQEARIELQAGDLTLIDASAPLDMHFHQRSRQLSLILPRAQVQSGTRGVGVACARRIEAGTPLASMARQLMLEAGRNQRMANSESQAVLDALIALLRPAISQDAVPGSHERMFRKALALIDRNIACEGLSPELIAREVGISMRSLYRIFAKHDLVIAQYIRNRRLDFCAESLRNPAMDQKVSSLGYAWGFSDSSYFSTAFKARFGMTPGEYRKRHAN
ncbi:transcriptional regulator FeaR [Pseudomonas putida]|uniref:Transcriptional regulator FeaR n=1 Tax=Pseudomonas putida TaxID=303 RepID=A0A7W2KYQ6_PSEPU|nr:MULTISPECIES: transcriptional regulator FeaR [Pseudomonas]MBA6115147.1 transcriptional regulator FeaR [Pseudomonas putida]MBI6939756.1 transcriptional regulator FeaR [Pseudomonas putida]MBI6956274.1 transcriptional regulator FeaR [Pseudomonas putida]MCZ9639330.1 transcriptional regulator FeaR [Pseudomonas putida]MEC4874726.1 transcriptional regulator FeaR [Pseudomonas sp. NC26]